MFLINILVFIFVLGLVILIHELGHFIMAKRAGILCHEFALGMGPVLISKKKGETVYSIRAIPIGGFVMMAGEEISSDMVKEGQDIKVRRQNGKITHLILNAEDERYKDAESITVESVDLLGKDDGKLTLNGEPVDNKAFYVLKDKKLQVAPYDRSFDSKSLRQRFSAIFAGPFMNFVLAFFLFILISLIIGFPKTDEQGRITTEIGAVSEQAAAYGILEPGDVILEIEGQEVNSFQNLTEFMSQNKGLREVGLTVDRDGETVDVTVTPRIVLIAIGIATERDPDDPHALIVGQVLQNSPGAEAGFQPGDRILSIDGEEVTTWTDVIDKVEANRDGEAMSIEIERDETAETLTVEPYEHSLLESQNAPAVQVQIGISPVHERDISRSVIISGFRGIRQSSTLIFDTLRMLFGGQVGIGDLAGPVGIYAITASAFQQGLIAFLNWTALLSVNLGILNLLPIPALDGGRIVFLGYEGITGKKVNKTVENYLHLIMFILLIGLLLFVTYSDILRLLNIG